MDVRINRKANRDVPVSIIFQMKCTHLRPPAGRQYGMPYLSNHSTDHYQIFSSCYLCQMKAKLKVSVNLHMGNYVNQVHHTTNTREGREVKNKN